MKYNAMYFSSPQDGLWGDGYKRLDQQIFCPKSSCFKFFLNLSLFPKNQPNTYHSGRPKKDLNLWALVLPPLPSLYQIRCDVELSHIPGPRPKYQGTPKPWVSFTTDPPQRRACRGWVLIILGVSTAQCQNSGGLILPGCILFGADQLPLLAFWALSSSWMTTTLQWNQVHFDFDIRTLPGEVKSSLFWLIDTRTLPYTEQFISLHCVYCTPEDSIMVFLGVVQCAIRTTIYRDTATFVNAFSESDSDQLPPPHTHIHIHTQFHRMILSSLPDTWVTLIWFPA